MAKNATSDEVARGADVSLKLATAGPRDALIDPRDGDIVPDSEEKGYHVGEVRQPAEPVLYRGGEVTFESLPEAGPSKFDGNSLADLKAAHNEREASDDAYAGVEHVADLLPGEEAPAARRAPARATTASSAATQPTVGNLDRDSAKVARSQSADDK